MKEIRIIDGVAYIYEWIEPIKEITLDPSEYKVISKVKPKPAPPYLDI